MSEKQFRITTNPKSNAVAFDEKQKKHYIGIDLEDLLNEQQAMINELKTYNLQHFLEWLVIKGYVTDEPMKDINNVIDCVGKFKEYLNKEYEQEII